MGRNGEDKPPDPSTEKPTDGVLWLFGWRLPKSCGVPPGLREEVVIPVMVRQAAEHPPGTPYYFAARFELLSALKSWHRLDEAIALLDELLAAEIPKEHQCEALMLVGSCADWSGRFDVAVKCYQRVIEADPGSPRLRYFSRSNLASSLIGLGRFEDATTPARQAIEIRPRLVEAHRNLAMALEGLGRLEQAAEAYLRSVYLWPTDPRAYRALVRLSVEHPELLDKLDYLRTEIEFCKSIMKVLMTEKHWTTETLGPPLRNPYWFDDPPAEA